MTFIDLCGFLNLDRANLAYHIRLLKKGGLVENYYKNLEGSRSYSHYRLTQYARWLITHNINMTLESQHYQRISEEKKGSLAASAEITEQSSRKGPQTKIEAYKGDQASSEEPIKIKTDPRVRYYDYKIYLKK